MLARPSAPTTPKRDRPIVFRVSSDFTDTSSQFSEELEEAPRVVLSEGVFFDLVERPATPLDLLHYSEAASPEPIEDSFCSPARLLKMYEKRNRRKAVINLELTGLMFCEDENLCEDEDFCREASDPTTWDNQTIQPGNQSPKPEHEANPSIAYCLDGTNSVIRSSQIPHASPRVDARCSEASTPHSGTSATTTKVDAQQGTERSLDRFIFRAIRLYCYKPKLLRHHSAPVTRFGDTLSDQS